MTANARFPKLAPDLRAARLTPPAGPVRLVLDTDTYNEVDDQFALAYALLARQKLTVEGIYAAPFTNNRSTGPGDGMEKSFEEIMRLLPLLSVPPNGLVHRGATAYLDPNTPLENPATADLIRQAMASGPDEPLYVVAIGALTNVTTALLLEPRIIKHIVVVWLGGHALHWPDTREFNLAQDIAAAQVLFDCGAPLVLIPCQGVASHLHTTVPELAAHLAGQNDLCDFLLGRVQAYSDDHFAWSKVLWDVAAIAWLLDAAWVPTELVPSPVLTAEATWEVDRRRPAIRSATFVQRDPIFRDLFTRLRNVGRRGNYVERDPD